MKPGKLDEIKNQSSELFRDELGMWVHKYVTEYESFQSPWVFAEVTYKPQICTIPR
jgi:hypothetical protein